MSFASQTLGMLGVIGGAVKLAQRQYTAQNRVSQIQQAKQQQKKTRRNFINDYLSRQETSLGIKVGDLPERTQKKITSQYSQYERKKIMNKMDKETKNK